MLSSDEKSVARRILGVQRQHEGLSRTRQLPGSSVVSADGSEASLADALVGSVETAATVAGIGSDVDDHGDLVDSGTDFQIDVPEWMTGVDASPGFNVSVIAATRAGEAQATANSAAVEASQAVENSYGNARYRYFPATGDYVPELPVDGARAGAERVHIDADGHPFQVDVFTGTVWNKLQLLSDQILVLGPGGTVQIENATVVAPKIIGGEVVGGKLILSNRENPSVSLNFYGAGTNSTAPYRSWNTRGATSSQSVGVAPSWIASFVFKASQNLLIAWDVARPPLGMGNVTITAEMRSSAAGTFFVNLGAQPVMSAATAANTWRTVTLTRSNTWLDAQVNVGMVGTSVLGQTIEIRNLTFSVSTTDVGTMSIERDESGFARLLLTDSAGAESTRVDQYGIWQAGRLVSGAWTRGNSVGRQFLVSNDLVYPGMEFTEELIDVATDLPTGEARKYIWQKNQWLADVTQSGSVAFSTSLAAGVNDAIAVTFDEPFAAAPAVTLNWVGSTNGISAEVMNHTSTGVTIRVRNVAASAITPGTCRWYARGNIAG